MNSDNRPRKPWLDPAKRPGDRTDRAGPSGSVIPLDIGNVAF